jgi:hypothetical protein
LADNRFSNLTAGNEGVFIAGSYNGSTGTRLDAHDNTWINGQFTGMNVSSAQGEVYNNTFSGIAYYGILVANHSSLHITKNTFSGIVNPDLNVNTYGAAVRFYTPAVGMTTSVTNNYFTGNYIGVAVRAAGGDLTGRNIDVSHNSFTGNTAAHIFHAGPAGTLAATCNWYGTADTAIISPKVQGSVSWKPLLTDGTDTDTAISGFQPDGGSCEVPAGIASRQAGPVPARLLQDVILSPNPVRDILTVESGFAVTDITVTDGTGRTVLQVKDSRTVSMKDLAPGIYLIRINGQVSRKIVKE